MKLVDWANRYGLAVFNAQHEWELGEMECSIELPPGVTGRITLLDIAEVDPPYWWCELVVTVPVADGGVPIRLPIVRTGTTARDALDAVTEDVARVGLETVRLEAHP